jgi:hypothetical protein
MVEIPAKLDDVGISHLVLHRHYRGHSRAQQGSGNSTPRIGAIRLARFTRPEESQTHSSIAKTLHKDIGGYLTWSTRIVQ